MVINTNYFTTFNLKTLYYRLKKRAWSVPYECCEEKCKKKKDL